MHSNPDHIVFTKQSYEHMYIWLINRVRKEKHQLLGGGVTDNKCTRIHIPDFPSPFFGGGY